MVFTTTEYRSDGSLGVVELDGSCTSAVGPASSLWPGDSPRQSSEADYGNASPPFDQRLNYTTTDSDPAGDVEYAHLTAPFAGGFTASRLDNVAPQEERAQSHGSHYEFGKGMFASYTVRSQSADVSDVVAADGSARRVVASPDSQEQTDERSPTYSPDGTRVAYARRVADEQGYEIVVAHADGTNAQPLVVGRYPNEVFTEPAWSSDGTRIAFVEQHPVGELYDLSWRRILIADVATGRVVLSRMHEDDAPRREPFVVCGLLSRGVH